MATQQIIGEGGVGTGQYFDTATGNVVPTPTANTGNVTTPSGAIVNPTIGGLVTPPPNYATQPITSSVTTPASVPTYQTSTTPTPPAISGIDTTLQNNATTLSPAEQGISDITKRITDINNSLLGKATYTQQQNVVQGLPDLQKAQNDLVAQIKGFQNQSQALQNAYNYTIPNQMNLQAEGRGITQAGLQPITASELRKNQIQQGAIATQALTAGATLEAIKGNIANAQNLVDQAVAAKFGPLEEQNKVATENLATLLKDPNISLAEKNRATAQLEVQKQQEAQIASDKQKTADILKISTDAATNGVNFDSKANPLYPTLASAIKAISEAKTQAEATQIASSVGLGKSPTATVSTGYPAYVSQEVNAGREPMSIKDWILFNKNAQVGIGVNTVTGATYQTRGPGMVGLSGSNKPTQVIQNNQTNPSQVQQEYTSGHAISALPQGVPSVSSVVDGAALQLFNGQQAPSEIKSRGAIGQAMINQANAISMKLTGKPFDVAGADNAFTFRQGSQYNNYTAAAPSALRNITAISADAQKLPLTGLSGINDIAINAIASGLDPFATEEQKSAAKDIQARLAQSKDDIGLLLGTGTGSDMKLALGGLIYNPNGSPKQTADLTKSVQETIMNKLGDYYAKAGVSDPSRYLQNDMIKLIGNSGLQVSGLINQGDQYASYRSQVPTGSILINRGGQIGHIPTGEFNPQTDTKL